MPGARTVDEYLASLPEERRQVVTALRQLVLDNLPAGFEESMTYGVPTYEVPLERYPNTYNGKPLGLAALAAKKNYYTLHLINVYANPAVAAALQEGFARSGRKLDMGKGCVRFRRLEDLALDVIAGIIAGTSLDNYVAHMEAAQRQRTAGKQAKPARRATARKAAGPARKGASRRATTPAKKASSRKATTPARKTASRKATTSARKTTARRPAKPLKKKGSAPLARRRRR